MCRLWRGLCASLLAVWLLPSQALATEPPWASRVEALIASMSLEDKVGQLLMVGFAGTSINPHISHWVQDRHVGGVALFSRNIVDLAQTARFTRELQALSAPSLPIFLALDQEGGNVVRVKEGALSLPGNMALGATRSARLAYVAGQALAIDLQLLGFNMNLAPVLDINSNPQNPVIGTRSYGERPQLVGDIGTWYIRGMQEMGMVAVAKHFPGHGDTQTDSHFSMPTINANLTRLNSMELAPFKQAIGAGLDAVMTAHIALPQVAEGADVPATLSSKLLTQVLRHSMKFDGLVITDGLEMQGIVQRYGSGKAAVLAILAGADMPMVLWSTDSKEEVYQALLSAVRSGVISTPRLNESVRRILTVKARRGIFERNVAPLSYVLKARNKNAVHDAVAQRIAEDSLTLVRNQQRLLPLATKPMRIVVLAPPGNFARLMAADMRVRVLTVPFVPTREQRRVVTDKLTAMLADADVFVAAAMNRYQIDVAKAARARLRRRIPMALLSFASPYYLRNLPDADAYLCTYSYQEIAQEAAASAVLGRLSMRGRLPVTIPGMYAYGQGAATKH